MLIEPNKLAAARALLAARLADIAALAGVSPASISLQETGDRRATAVMNQRLASFYAGRGVRFLPHGVELVS